jgi:predicted MPP superfamily phosphohydrolase
LIAFIAVILTISGLIHWFLYARLVGALDITSPAILWPLRSAAILLAVSYVLIRLWERIAPEPAVYAGEWVAANWIGMMFELLWMTALMWIVNLLLRLFGIWSRFDATQQMLIGRWTAVAVISAALIVCGYAMWRAAQPARIARADVPVKNVTPELRNLNIALAADFHTGILVGKRQVHRMTTQIMSLHPDLILMPGDILDHPPQRLRRVAEEFRRLKAPLGVFGTTGNHEYYINVKASLALLDDNGLRMLNNEAVTLPNGLVIEGIADRTALQFHLPRPKIGEFVAEYANDKPTILLNHTPSGDEAQAAGRAGADLVVSGHTHGGQIWPFSLLTRLVFTYHHGLYPLERGHILTTCGIGTWGPAMRLGAPPEIVLIKLVGENEPASIRWE